MRSSSKEYHQQHVRPYYRPSKYIITNKGNIEKYKNVQHMSRLSKEIIQTYPYSSLGIITVTNQSRRIIKGTGAMISANLVVTAAHNIFDRKQGPFSPQRDFKGNKKYNMRYNNIKFHPGVDGQFNEQEGFIVESWRCPLQYTDLSCKNSQLYDYALLKLVDSIPKPIGRYLRPVSYCHYCLLHQDNEEDLLIYGYASDKTPNRSKPLRKQGQSYKKLQQGLKTSIKIKKMDDREKANFYENSIIKVQNGSPIIFRNSYIGVYNGCNKGENSIFGRLFTKQLIEDLLKWCCQLKGDPFKALKQYPCQHSDSYKIKYSTMELLQKGNQSQHQKNYEQALAQYNKVLELDPKNCEALRRKGQCLHNMKNYTAAIKEYTKAIEVNCKDSQAYTERAFAHYHKKKYGKCQKDCKAALKIDPNNSNAYLYKGYMNWDLEKYEQALNDCNRAINLNNTNVRALHLRGNINRDLKNYEKALDDYSIAIKIDPEFAIAYYNRGVIYNNREDFSKALDDFTTAIKINPKLTIAYKSRGFTYNYIKQDDKALNDYNIVILINPKDADAYVNRGQIYNDLTDYDRALADYNTAIKINPRLAMAYNHRGLTYNELKDYDKALADYNRAIQIDPKTAIFYNCRGITYFDLNDYDKALADYTTAIKIDPKYANAYYNRGVIYYDLNDYDKALADYTVSIEIIPKLAISYFNRGNTYFDLKDYDKALADYTTVIQIDPKQTDAYFNRGMIFRHLKDYDKAFADFIALITLDQQSEQVFTFILSILEKKQFHLSSSSNFQNILKKHSTISSVLFRKGIRYKSQNYQKNSVTLYKLAFHIEISNLYYNSNEEAFLSR